MKGNISTPLLQYEFLALRILNEERANFNRQQDQNAKMQAISQDVLARARSRNETHD